MGQKDGGLCEVCERAVGCISREAASRVCIVLSGSMNRGTGGEFCIYWMEGLTRRLMNM